MHRFLSALQLKTKSRCPQRDRIAVFDAEPGRGSSWLSCRPGSEKNQGVAGGSPVGFRVSEAMTKQSLAHTSTGNPVPDSLCSSSLLGQTCFPEYLQGQRERGRGKEREKERNRRRRPENPSNICKSRNRFDGKRREIFWAKWNLRGDSDITYSLPCSLFKSAGASGSGQKMFCI